MERIFSGVYLHDGFVFEPQERCPFYWDFETWKAYVDHLHTCRIGIMEFCTQASFLRIPSTDFERSRIGIMREVIRYAHKKGLKVWLILSSNVLSLVPAGQLPVDQRESKSFLEPCPQVPENYRKLCEVTSYFIGQYAEADGFEIFAGDWGGCGCGKCDYRTYLWLAGEYYRMIRRLNTTALICLNTWSVSSWAALDHTNISWREIFDLEAAVNFQVIDAIDALPPDVGITMPFHHLYRPLAVGGRSYDQCPSWPDGEAIGRLRRSGREVFAWPHFIMENDPYHLGRWGYFNCRVRYLHELVGKLLDRNVSGIVGNLYNPFMQPLSAYAFGRLCENRSLAPGQILGDFAALVAEEDCAPALYEVLVFMENNDPWETDLPDAVHLNKLPSSLDLQTALHILADVRPAAANVFLTQNGDILNNIAASLKLLSGPMENAGLS